MFIFLLLHCVVLLINWLTSNMKLIVSGVVWVNWRFSRPKENFSIRRCHPEVFYKKAVLKILRNLQENRNSDRGVFLFFLKKFSKQLFYRTPVGDYYYTIQIVMNSFTLIVEKQRFNVNSAGFNTLWNGNQVTKTHVVKHKTFVYSAVYKIIDICHYSLDL